jgi:hypothetical protein
MILNNSLHMLLLCFSQSQQPHQVSQQIGRDLESLTSSSPVQDSDPIIAIASKGILFFLLDILHLLQQAAYCINYLRTAAAVFIQTLVAGHVVIVR